MGKEISIRGIVLGKGIPAIAVPLTAKEKRGLLEEARAAREAGADLVEWRADSYGDRSSESILKTLSALAEVLEPHPLIFTLRTKAEGGSLLELSWKDYADLNLLAAKSGMVDFVDVEVLRGNKKAAKLISEIQAEGVRAIASSHDFTQVPEDEVLLERLKALLASGADILKMAVMPSSLSDTHRFMEVIREFSKDCLVPIIAMAMGEMGQESRIYGERFGSCLTFGIVGASSAPGQLPVGELKEKLSQVHRSLLEGSDGANKG